MSHVMPQVALHRVIQEGIAILKQNPAVLDDIFQFYLLEPLNKDFGTNYVDNIKTWFTTTEIPVVQAWSVNPQKVPQISIKLAVEQEDEAKAAIGDHWDMGEEANVGTQADTVNLDINIMTSRNGDETLWMFYIVKYILFKRKRRAEELGLQLGTFSASDYMRDQGKLADNIWTRTIRYRCTAQNFWDSEPYLDINDLEVELIAESSSSIDAESTDPDSPVVEI